MNDTYISTESLNKQLGEAYNKGIEDAIAIIRDEYSIMDWNPHIGVIIEKLESLKKHFSQ